MGVTGCSTAPNGGAGSPPLATGVTALDLSVSRERSTVIAGDPAFVTLGIKDDLQVSAGRMDDEGPLVQSRSASDIVAVRKLLRVQEGGDVVDT